MATGSIVTTAFRLAFPQVFAPKAAVQGGKESYSITMLFPKEGNLMSAIPGAGVMEIRKLLHDAVKEKWGEDKNKWPAQYKSLDFKTYLSPTGKDGWPLRDGDEVKWDGFAGNVFIRASSNFAPGFVDQKRQPIINPANIFGGLICRAQVNAFAYDTAGNKGVSLGVQNFQVLKDDGTAFSGGAKAADVFEAFGDNTVGVGEAVGEAW